MPRGKNQSEKIQRKRKVRGFRKEYLQKTELHVSFVPKLSPIISMQTFSPSHLGRLRLAKGPLL